MQTFQEAQLCFPLLLNSSCKKLVLPQPVRTISFLLLSSMSLLTVMLNLLVIISISHFRQLHTPTNLLLLSLAVSDFLIGFRISFQIVLLDSCWLLGDHICVVFIILDYIITSASIGTMVLISIDRYVAICDPMHYPIKFSQRRVKVHVCWCWAASALIQIVLLRDNLIDPGSSHSCSGECALVQDQVSGLVDLLLSFIGPVSIIIVLHVRVFLVVVAQARAMRSQITAVALVKVRVKKSEIKAARTLGVVIVLFLICLCPYFCASLTGQGQSVNIISDTFLICLFYLNSCLNPMFFAFFYPWFRKSMKLIVTLQILKSGSSDSKLVKSERRH
ncbi:trace amine-associated receptor 13c-like [Hippoglossus stenolepis]|uniref:trace amine-associated receptor 13c-like n=1 Tax=Hippoglossus stenolepis TaxID=195615 RepID=UPI001FAFB0B2|nr:trace amine-associated receptor 13c-like [Hippoglossus stenolepis]